MICACAKHQLGRLISFRCYTTTYLSNKTGIFTPAMAPLCLIFMQDLAPAKAVHAQGRHPTSKVLLQSRVLTQDLGCTKIRQKVGVYALARRQLSSVFETCARRMCRLWVWYKRTFTKCLLNRVDDTTQCCNQPCTVMTAHRRWHFD